MPSKPVATAAHRTDSQSGPLAKSRTARPLLLALTAGLSACASTGVGGTAVAPATQPDYRGHASQPVTPSPLAVPLDAASLSALPRERVRAHTHGRVLDCEGVALTPLLRRAGAMRGSALPGEWLSHYVLVQGRGGDRVLFALAELDPGTGGRKAYLVDRCGGAPLGAQDGLLRLIAPEDAGPARWVRQVEAVTVIAAP